MAACENGPKGKASQRELSVLIPLLNGSTLIEFNRTDVEDRLPSSSAASVMIQKNYLSAV